MKVTIELNEQDVGDLAGLLERISEMLEDINEQYPRGYSNLTKEDKG